MLYKFTDKMPPGGAKIVLYLSQTCLDGSTKIMRIKAKFHAEGDWCENYVSFPVEHPLRGEYEEQQENVEHMDPEWEWELVLEVEVSYKQALHMLEEV